MRIPRHLREAAREDAPDLRGWVADLPGIVSGLAQRWALQLGEPYEPGGQCSWVAPATNASGDEVVLKVGWCHPEAEREADALRVWRGDGAVLLHAAETFDGTSALLLERSPHPKPRTLNPYRLQPTSRHDQLPGAPAAWSAYSNGLVDVGRTYIPSVGYLVCQPTVEHCS